MTKSASLRSRHTSEQSDWGYCCKSQLRRADFRSVQEMEKWGGYGIEESHINNPPERVENYLIRRWQNPVCGVFERTSRWYCRCSTTKSCFQSANEILCKLRSHGLEEIHINNPLREQKTICFESGVSIAYVNFFCARVTWCVLYFATEWERAVSGTFAGTSGAVSGAGSGASSGASSGA